MREHLFRGKARSGKWVIGNLVISAPQKGSLSDRDYYIFPIEEEGMYLVDPKTVGEYTGLLDKNGFTKIFEGDIVPLLGNSYNAEIIFSCGCFCLIYRNIRLDDGKIKDVIVSMTMGTIPDNVENPFTVIGNIHDNPELLCSM